MVNFTLEFQATDKIPRPLPLGPSQQLLTHSGKKGSVLAHLGLKAEAGSGQRAALAGTHL